MQLQDRRGGAGARQRHGLRPGGVLLQPRHQARLDCSERARVRHDRRQRGVDRGGARAVWRCAIPSLVNGACDVNMPGCIFLVTRGQNVRVACKHVLVMHQGA